MSAAGREAGLGLGVRLYVRHRPERTLLYQIVDEYYPACKQHLESQDASLPRYVEQEFEEYLKCGRLEHGFLRVRCDSCHAEYSRRFCPEQPLSRPSGTWTQGAAWRAGGIGR